MATTKKTEKVEPEKAACPPDSVEVGPFYVRPFVSWSVASGPFGCYAMYISLVKLHLDIPTHKWGVPLTADQRAIDPRTFRFRCITEEDYRQIATEYGFNNPFGGGVHIGSLASRKKELFKTLFKKGMDNVWNTFLATYGNVGMLMFGDVTREGISSYSTQWLAWYLKQRGEGVLSATHGVVNPNYPREPRVCQVWAWTPPRNAPMTTRAGFNTSLVRDAKELRHNIVKHWNQNPGEVKVDLEVCPLPEDGELNQVSSV